MKEIAVTSTKGVPFQVHRMMPRYTYILTAFRNGGCVQVRTLVTSDYIYSDSDKARQGATNMRNHWRTYHPDEELDYIDLYLVDTRETTWDKWKFPQPSSFGPVWKRKDFDMHFDSELNANAEALKADCQQGNLDSGA